MGCFSVLGLVGMTGEEDVDGWILEGPSVGWIGWVREMVFTNDNGRSLDLYDIFANDS